MDNCSIDITVEKLLCPLHRKTEQEDLQKMIDYLANGSRDMREMCGCDPSDGRIFLIRFGHNLPKIGCVHCYIQHEQICHEGRN